MRHKVTVAVLLLAGRAALAHRLDEYLQNTILSVEKNHVEAQMTLTPGVAVYPIVLAAIDTNGDGFVSAAEQRAYADRVLRDLVLEAGGHRLRPRLVSMEFPPVEDMKEGRGEIRIGFQAEIPPDRGSRSLTLENHHQGRIAAYQVNCLVSSDPDIQIVRQTRDYTQSRYRLDYVQAGALSVSWPAGGGLVVAVALPLVGRFAFLWRRSLGRRKRLPYQCPLSLLPPG